MQETDNDVSLLTANVCSMSSVWVLRIFTELWQPHQSFPDTGSIFVTGEATVPTETVVGSDVFQPPTAIERYVIIFIQLSQILRALGSPDCYKYAKDTEVFTEVLELFE